MTLMMPFERTYDPFSKSINFKKKSQECMEIKGILERKVDVCCREIAAVPIPLKVRECRRSKRGYSIDDTTDVA